MLKRGYDRRDTQISARIMTGARALDCVVRDVSAGGARLRVADPAVVPHEFQLVFERTGDIRRAKVRWRRAKDVGVMFLTERRVFGKREIRPNLAE